MKIAAMSEPGDVFASRLKAYWPGRRRRIDISAYLPHLPRLGYSDAGRPTRWWRDTQLTGSPAILRPLGHPHRNARYFLLTPLNCIHAEEYRTSASRLRDADRPLDKAQLRVINSVLTSSPTTLRGKRPAVGWAVVSGRNARDRSCALGGQGILGVRPMKAVLHVNTAAEIDDLELDWIASIFRQSGFEVVRASDAIEGLPKVLKVDPNLILLGEEVPPVEVGDFLPVLRRLSDAPITIVGGRGLPLEMRALVMGTDFYLRRPIKRDVLFARARALLRRSAGMLGRDCGVWPPC